MRGFATLQLFRIFVNFAFFSVSGCLRFGFRTLRVSPPPNGWPGLLYRLVCNILQHLATLQHSATSEKTFFLVFLILRIQLCDWTAISAVSLICVAVCVPSVVQKKNVLMRLTAASQRRCRFTVGSEDSWQNREGCSDRAQSRPPAGW